MSKSGVAALCFAILSVVACLSAAQPEIGADSQRFWWVVTGELILLMVIFVLLSLPARDRVDG